MTIRKGFLIGLPLLIVIFILVGFGLGLGRTSHVIKSPLIGKPIPTFSLVSANGKQTLTQNDLKGHVSLLNFFASWCQPCRLEHPLFVQYAKQHHLRIYGIAWKETAQHIKRWYQELGNPYVKDGIDGDMRVGIAFGVIALPESYVIDKKGIIRYKATGIITRDKMNKVIIPLMRKLEAQ